LSDCKVGSQEITFYPKRSIETDIKIKLGTAGSIGLLLQPIQIACLGFNNTDKIEVSIKGGGTFGKWAPSLNYLKEVTYNILRNYGLNIDIDIIKHGFYPKGGALVKCTIHPPKEIIKPILLTELGDINEIQGEIIVTDQLKKRNVGERVKKSTQQYLKKNLSTEYKINYKYVKSLSPGVGISLWASSDTGAIMSSGTILGERNITSEELGKIAAKELITYIKNDIPIDKYLSDQLIPYMGFAKEQSKIKVLKITSHTKTNLELIKLFLNRNYQIKKENGHFIIII
jgi:RNA 3'-terminal phosphate cyclase (ATP)/RNA 3'-terminal phosphate cyclase (GTP)